MLVNSAYHSTAPHQNRGIYKCKWQFLYLYLYRYLVYYRSHTNTHFKVILLNVLQRNSCHGWVINQQCSFETFILQRELFISLLCIFFSIKCEENPLKISGACIIIIWIFIILTLSDPYIVIFKILTLKYRYAQLCHPVEIIFVWQVDITS